MKETRIQRGLKKKFEEYDCSSEQNSETFPLYFAYRASDVVRIERHYGTDIIVWNVLVILFANESPVRIYIHVLRNP